MVYLIAVLKFVLSLFRSSSVALDICLISGLLELVVMCSSHA